MRVIQTGVQVLFAFLLMAPLTARFPALDGLQKAEYSVTLLHLVGLACVGVAVLGALVFVTGMLFSDAVAVATTGGAAALMLWTWALAPLVRRRRVLG